MLLLVNMDTIDVPLFEDFISDKVITIVLAKKQGYLVEKHSSCSVGSLDFRPGSRRKKDANWIEIDCSSIFDAGHDRCMLRY